MYLTFLLITLVFLVLTLLPLLRVDAWWVRGLDFPRLQLFSLGLVLLLLELTLLDLSSIKSWVLLGLVLACLLYHGIWILPYTPLMPVEVRSAATNNPRQTLRILNANVLGDNRNAEGLLDLVREHRPDILVTLETNHWWQEQLDVLEADYPYTIKCPLDNLYGMHVYSRLRLVDSEVAYLLVEDIPSMHTTVLLDSGARIAAHFLHPKPPAPSESKDSSSRDVELIIVGRRVADNPGPVIVAGDLNDVAWSRTTRLFRKISGLYDPRIGRGMFNTFHASYFFLRWPLDHLFHSRHFTLASIRRLPGFGSDHFPLFTELVYDGERQNPDNTPELDAADRSLAQDKVDEEPVSKADVPEKG